MFCLLVEDMVKKQTRYYLILDQKVVLAGDGFVEAFDRLFKAHYCFNACYAHVLTAFYEFTAAYIYGILPPAKVKASVRALASLIMTKDE